jgi:hypothetical protein
MSMKGSNDTIGNRTRDLLACNAVPQPTAPRRAPHTTNKYFKNYKKQTVTKHYDDDNDDYDDSKKK